VRRVVRGCAEPRRGPASLPDLGSTVPSMDGDKGYPLRIRLDGTVEQTAPMHCPNGHPAALPECAGVLLAQPTHARLGLRRLRHEDLAGPVGDAGSRTAHRVTSWQSVPETQATYRRAPGAGTASTRARRDVLEQDHQVCTRRRSSGAIPVISTAWYRQIGHP
jgi:hypothetical protein